MNIEKYTGEPRKKQRLFLIIIIALAVLYTAGFSYINWNPTYGGWIQNVISILFFLFLIINLPKGRKYNFKSEILLLIILPFISSINTYMLYGQSFYDSIRALTGNFVWVFYFVLHKYKVQESTILKAFLIISLFIAGVQILQQFTYPNALFGVSDEDSVIEKGLTEIAEKRNGLWRFRMAVNGYFTAPILFACLMWARKKINNKLIILIAVMLISIYLTLTRQVIAACLLAVFMSFFLGKRNKGMARAMILGVILLSVIYAYSDVLFGSLAEQTSEDMNDSNIRLFAASYFWEASIKNPMTFLLGYGIPGQHGEFASLTDYIQHTLFLFTNDVGFIGRAYEAGYIYVIACYYLLWKVFFKNKEAIPVYIRTFVIFTGVMSIMIFPMASTVYFFVWSCLLYICDIHINKERQNSKLTRYNHDYKNIQSHQSKVTTSKNEG